MLMFQYLLVAGSLFHSFSCLFKTCLFMVKVSASDGPGRSRILVISVLLKTCALLGCYQWFAYELILSLCHSVSTSLLPCNIYIEDDGDGSRDQLVNKYILKA